MQRRQKFRERGEREGRRTAFQSGFLLSHLKRKDSVRCTASVSPLDRDKGTLPLTRKNACAFFRHISFWDLLRQKYEIHPLIRTFGLLSDSRSEFEESDPFLSIVQVDDQTCTHRRIGPQLERTDGSSGKCRLIDNAILVFLHGERYFQRIHDSAVFRQTVMDRA